MFEKCHIYTCIHFFEQLLVKGPKVVRIQLLQLNITIKTNVFFKKKPVFLLTMLVIWSVRTCSHQVQVFLFHKVKILKIYLELESIFVTPPPIIPHFSIVNLNSIDVKHIIVFYVLFTFHTSSSVRASMWTPHFLPHSISSKSNASMMKTLFRLSVFFFSTFSTSNFALSALSQITVEIFALGEKYSYHVLIHNRMY